MDDYALVLDELRAGPPLFLTQLSARTGLPLTRITEILDALPESSVVITRHTSPDPHITTDLRIASLVHHGDVAAAVTTADRLWRSWLMNFLQKHRCA